MDFVSWTSRMQQKKLYWITMFVSKYIFVEQQNFITNANSNENMREKQNENAETNKH